jgi:hypothetical protein
MIEFTIETAGEKLNIIYFQEECSYPDALLKVNEYSCRMPTMVELRIIFDFVVNNQDTGIPNKGSIWSSDPVEVRGRNDQFVMTKSFYDGKQGGDAGMEGMQAHVNLSVKQLVIGIKN